MKWIILIAIIVLVAFWLSRGRAIRRTADPEMRTVEKQDYYVKPTPDGAPSQTLDNVGDDNREDRDRHI